MLSNTLLRGFDRSRLKKLLALFFVALSLPTAILIWQAYGQLKWESFHQHRGVAEEFTNRIDSRLSEMTGTADARSFADYAFLVVTGDPKANFLQRSPLSSFPVTQDLPGVIGYFQVDAAGEFSTPLVPPDGTAIEKLGMDDDEYAARTQLANEINAILADNRLTRFRADARIHGRVLAEPEPQDADAQEEKNAGGEGRFESGSREAPSAAAASPQTVDEVTVFGAVRADIADDSPTEPAADNMRETTTAAANERYSQEAFDQLAQSRQRSPFEDFAGRDAAGTPSLEQDLAEFESAYKASGKVADIKLDSSYQRKSEDAERNRDDSFATESARSNLLARPKRREQSAVPESPAPSAGMLDREILAPADLRISTFESEIDPFEFSMLDSGHFVFFRKVWRGGERYIQGLLVDRQAFLREVTDEQFTATALGSMSNLIVAYQDDVIHSISAPDANRYPNGSQALASQVLDGALLYRSRLSAPLDSLEFIFTVKRLPPGPGASVLSWVTVVLAIVFAGGFYLLFRLGSTQIELARQQQDFVSAVSHELKTPLTSIRMYGEMLKEGWADDAKRQSYYEFIHDESERLSRLISNVLQLANITRNEPQFELKPVRVGQIMSNIESKISHQVERAGFELVLQEDENAAAKTVDIDDDCFAQIIINLVDNAIKFSRDARQKKIDIRCQPGSGNRVVFKVRDYGPGIPKDQLKKIFTLFYRSESELTRETVGTGIGLAIVHQLSNAMNGQIDVVNCDPGTEFRITLPSS